MARINTYIKDTDLTDKDLLIGSNYVSGGAGTEIYETANFTLGAVKSYVGATGGDSTFLKESSTTLTSAQLLSLNGGGEIELIEAPGANKVIQIISYAHFLDFNTTAYNLAGADVALFYSGESQPIWGLFLGSINASADYYYAPGSANGTSNVGVPNAGIVFGTDAGMNVTQGDSLLKINILYRIVEFS